SSVPGQRNAMRPAGRSPAESDDEGLREAPRTQQAPSLGDASRVGASAPLPDGLRPPERLYFHPNKEQRANDSVYSRCCAASNSNYSEESRALLLSDCV